MSDKEERIFVFATKKYTIKETKEDGVIVDGSIEPNKAKVYTRQEAIEVMARALCKVELNCKCVCDIKCGAWKIETKQAEAALNALLEGVKK